MRRHFCATCLPHSVIQLFTEKHVHFTIPDDVMTLVLFKFLYCSFYEKKKKKCFCFYKMLINAVAAEEHMLKK